MCISDSRRTERVLVAAISVNRDPSNRNPQGETVKAQLISSVLVVAAAIAAPAHATTVSLAADGSWNEFNVDNQVAPSFGNGWIDFTDGSPLSFTFTIAAGRTGHLTVVDAGFAGDTFSLTNFGAAIGSTTAVPTGTTDGPVVSDFDQALADPSFSQGVFTFGAGTYRISGLLNQSVLDGGAPLDATDGAVRLQVSAVPEPSPFALLLAGLGAIGLLIRRRARGDGV
jgi:hypothetical protein